MSESSLQTPPYTSPQTSSPRDFAMRAGIEMGLWFGAVFVLEAQQLQHPVLGYLAVFVEALIVFSMCRLGLIYKVYNCEGRLSFGGAYRLVLWLFLCSSLVASVVRFVYLQWIDPGYLSEVYKQLSEAMQAFYSSLGNSANGMSVEEFLTGFQQLFTPIRYTVYMILSDLLNGLIWGLLIALYISKRKTPHVPGMPGKPGKQDETNHQE